MDRGNIVIMIAINLIAGVVLYQRLHSMGHVPSLKEMLHHYGESLFPPSPHMRPACGFVNSTKLVISSKRVVLDKGVAPASIVIINGKIESIRDKPPSDKYYTLIDYGDAVISPGVIDVHAHFNEPGREDWEGITTGTSAAAAGGITTVIDMPLNSHPCTTNVKLLREKMSVAKAKAHVNMGFWGGITPENANGDHQDLAAMIDAGALGFKSFMSPSGINDFVNVVKNDIKLVLPWLMRNAVPYLLHCELVGPVAVPLTPENKYEVYMNTRPPAFEQQAIHDLIDAMVETGKEVAPKEGFHVHIVHLADADSIHMVKVAKKKLRLTAETCAHYLTFASEDIPDGATEYKCAPPIRGAANKEKLIKGVTDGIIDLISSDHSPAPPSMKERESGNFLKAWGGISGIQYLLPATWSALSQRNMTDLKELAQLLSTSPAALANLQDRKGSIKPGMDADLVVWDPEQPADTSVEVNMHKHKLSPYTGRELWGKVMATFVGGSQVYRADVGMHKDVCGNLVLRRKKFIK